MPVFKFIIFVSLAAVMGCGSSTAADKPSGPPAFATPVLAVTIIPKTIEEKVAVVGSLSANESVELKSQIDGIIKEVRFEEGQKVAKGDVMVVLDVSKFEASLAEAKANAAMAETTFGRMKSLVDSGAVSKQEFDQAQSDVAAKTAQADLLQARLNDAVIASPFEGTVGERKVSEGQVIGKDMVLTVIIDGDPMKADFHVPERYIGRLKEGQSIQLKVAAYPNEIFEGDVYFIDPQVDDRTRTVLVKARVNNPLGHLRSGMFARIDLVIATKTEAITIPEIAVIPKGDDTFVFTVDAEKKAQMKPVKLGIRLAGEVEVLSGVNAGDIVITEGFQKIGPGSLVGVVDPNAPKETPQEQPKS